MNSQNTLEASDVTDESGKIRAEFPLKGDSPLIPHGTYVVLGDNGTKQLEITYRRGIPHGPFCDYWSTGPVACTGQFSEGKQDGAWRFYKEDGSLMEVIHFKAGKEIPPWETHDEKSP